MAECRHFITFHFTFWYFFPFFFSQFGAPNAFNIMEDSDRIIGGEPANITDFPYQIAMEYKDEGMYFQWCGAAVLDNFWLLTAAHCIYGKIPYNIRFRSGTSYREIYGEIHEMLKIIIHPQFNYMTKDFDVAVVKVANPFRYSDSVKPITLAYNTPEAGTLVVITGWGDSKHAEERPIQLQKAIMIVVDRSECLSAYGRNNRITPRMMCTGDPQGRRDTCRGDSGGPLVANGQLVGVASWGIGCAEGYPSVNADVAYFRSWILTTISIN